MKKIAQIILEANVVKRLSRTGFQFLDITPESLGEHTFMTTVIAYFLAKKLKADIGKILLMSTFHDFHEARTGDVHKLAKQYVKRDEGKANQDIFGEIDSELLKTINEYEDKKSLEAKITYEANILALLVHLKPFVEKNDPHAKIWFDTNGQRLRLKEAIELWHSIRDTDSQSWWATQRDILHKNYLEE